MFVGLGMMAFLSASMLAIDVGMFMTARSQAQNSADAGALAGAIALAVTTTTRPHAERPGGARARSRAAQANQVMAGEVSVTPADVEFLNDPHRASTNRVQGDVYRTRVARQPAVDADRPVLRHRRRPTSTRPPPRKRRRPTR